MLVFRSKIQKFDLAVHLSILRIPFEEICNLIKSFCYSNQAVSTFDPPMKKKKKKPPIEFVFFITLIGFSFILPSSEKIRCIKNET